MQNFTVFSVLLSFSVVFIVGDLVLHDYLNTGAEVGQEVQEIQASSEPQETESTQVETKVPASTPTPTPPEKPVTSLLTQDLFVSVGIANPVIKEVPFPGTVFQAIEFSDQKDAQLTERNVFDGENFIGTVYEIHYPTSTGSFQGYLTLRDRAKALTDLATVEEVNMYGEASFYFNHKQKTKTVHMVMRSGSNVFAFEYPYAQHENMKKLFDLLMVPL